MRSILVSLFLLLNSQLYAQELNNLENSKKFKFPANEINCMKHFKKDAIGVDPINAFLLAKMSELMYPERLDYQLRYLLNDSKPLTSLPSTDWIKAYPMIDNTNFRVAFESRFTHYFGTGSIDSTAETADFYFLENSKLDTLTFLGIKNIKGCDPELIVIDYENLVIILFRGTDDVQSNRFAEWKGTDFNLSKVRSDSVFLNAKMHKGFWESFELIQPELQKLLEKINAKEKSIWLSGHSLGGAMAILTGTYLQKTGYSISNIYTYATPRTIGNKVFAEITDSILPNKIHRFEYYLDPVSMVKMPGYKDIGKRHWFDNATKGNYTYYQNCGERYLFKKPFEFRRRPFAKSETREKSRVFRECRSGRMMDLPTKLFYHNTQWCVYATYNLIPSELKSELPKVDDSFPFIYYGWDQAK